MGLYSSESCTPDRLLAGIERTPLAEPVVILSGEGKLSRGSVLGKVTKGAATGAAVAGGTGNGTVDTISLGALAKVGVYKLVCIAAVADGGAFSVVDPDGIRLADAVEGAAYVGPIKFTLNAGETDWVVGDAFTITVAAGSGKYKLVDNADMDGSGVADKVLCEAVDATSADVVSSGYIDGEFNENELIFGGNDTIADHKATLEAKGIILRASAQA